MTDLDRLLELAKEITISIEMNEDTYKLNQEYQSLYEKLKKAEENQKHYDFMISLGRCITCHSKQHNYTKIGGGKKTDCCDYNVHFNECSHGDCSCECHILQENQKTPEDIEKIKKYDEHEVYKELFEKFQRENIKFQTEIQQLKDSQSNLRKELLSIGLERDQLKEEVLHLTALLGTYDKEIYKTANELLNSVNQKNQQINQLKQDSKTNAEKLEKFTKILGKIVYEESDYKDYIHAVQELQSILKETK